MIVFHWYEVEGSWFSFVESPHPAARMGAEALAIKRRRREGLNWFMAQLVDFEYGKAY